MYSSQTFVRGHAVSPCGGVRWRPDYVTRANSSGSGIINRRPPTGGHGDPLFLSYLLPNKRRVECEKEH